MYHLFFLSFLSIFLCMNTGQSAAADPKIPMSKKEKTRAQPDVFTNAQLAHKRGIMGTGEVAIVLELSFPSTMMKIASDRVTTRVTSTTRRPTKKIHADSVIHNLLMIAPKAHILFIDGSLHPQSVVNFFTKKQLKIIRDACVINRSMSFPGLLKGETFSTSWITKRSLFRRITQDTLDYIEHFKFLLKTGTDKILVQSAGNEAISLSDPISTGSYIKLNSGHKTACEDPLLYKHLIIAGAIGQRFTDTGFSSYPGIDKKIQDVTLYALGEDVELLGHQEELISGTSFSAPTISGAILLMKQKFPGLTVFEIKEALLESADRTFVLEDSDNLKKSVFVYESDTEKPNLDHFKGQEHISSIKFNPEHYGKGILNLKAAFFYGKLKASTLELKGRKFTPTQVRTRMKLILNKRQNASARKIQVAFKKHLFRKKKNKAATKIQALVRGHQARKRVDRIKAATKIQALVRGHQARKKGARKAGGI